jgi:hypothetical protein
MRGSSSAPGSSLVQSTQLCSLSDGGIRGLLPICFTDVADTFSPSLAGITIHPESHHQQPGAPLMLL